LKAEKINFTFPMLEDLLMSEMSRRNTDLVAGVILQKPELTEELFQVYFRNEEPVSRRAAWVLDTVTEKSPQLLKGRIDRMAETLSLFTHNGLKRHTLRMLARSPLPGRNQIGPLIDLCFNWLLSPTVAVATKIYCMDLLYRISEIEPEIKPELAGSIEWRLNEEFPGFRSHGKKMLKKLYSEIHSQP